MLLISRLTVRYTAGIVGCHAAFTVLDAIDLEVAGGDVVGVFGESGAGKSTLLLCAAGLKRPTSGEVRWIERSSSRRYPVHRVRYVSEESDGWRAAFAAAVPELPCLILLDDPFRHIGGLHYARLARGIAEAQRGGAGIVLTARERCALDPLATRVHELHGGRLIVPHSAAPREGAGMRARVAERAEFG